MMGEFADELHERAMQQEENLRAFRDFFKDCPPEKVRANSDGIYICSHCGKAMEL